VTEYDYEYEVPESVRKILAEAATRKPKRSQNLRSRYKTVIRERLSEVGIEVNPGYFTAAREKQINNINRHYDMEFLIKAVHWIFDNWVEIKRAGLFTDMAQPTFGVLVSQATLERYQTYIRDGTSLAELEHTGYSQSSDDEQYEATAPTTDNEHMFAELDRLRATKQQKDETQD